MGNIRKTHNTLQNNKGITVVLVAILMFVLVGFVGLALDVSFMYVVKGQLQNAADAGALAGAAKLNEVYASYPCDPSLYLSNIKQEAKKIAERNNAAGSPLTGAVEVADNVNELNDDNDITVGYWDAATSTYTPTMTNPNAVQVRVRRTTQSPLGQVRLFVSNLLGWQTMGTAAEAVADSEPAPLLPIVVNEYWLHREAITNEQVPYNLPVHTYPNSFVRETPVNPLPPGTEKAYGKVFAILGANADSNVPASIGKAGSQSINGYVNLDFRSSRHDGAKESWKQLDIGAGVAGGCSPPTYNFSSLSTIYQGTVDATKYDESLGYLLKGYKYVPPTAVKEQYRGNYTESNYDIPTSSSPYATVAHFSTSGKSALNKQYDGKYFYEAFPQGELLVAMVYDGTFKPNTDQQMPNAVTVVGYVLLKIDGYSSKTATQLTVSDKTTINDDFWQKGGNTAYAHAVAPIVEPTGGSFEDFYPELSRLRWQGAKVKLVMNRGIF